MTIVASIASIHVKVSRITVFVFTESFFKLIIKSVALHVWYAKPKIPQNKWMPGLLLILRALYFILPWNKTTTQKRHHKELDQQRSPHPKTPTSKHKSQWTQNRYYSSRLPGSGTSHNFLERKCSHSITFLI